ncbi:MAG: DNA polymerase III subunit alpha [Desulfobacteraceae bacterium]|nr:MAG: DNA polymerase III subunit alpha [Desulfobacteraceae bacterium]
MFTPLHVKSDYSLGFGTAAVDELAVRAAELGYRAIALTDIENLYGQVRFHAQCRARGLRALTGVELRPDFESGRRPGGRKARLVLLAADRSGYANLCRVVSRRRAGKFSGPAKNRSTGDLTDVLAGLSASLFALSDDDAVLAQLLSRGLFQRDRLALLVIRPAKTEPTGRLRESARRLGVPLAADLDVVFLHPDDHALHLLQLAVHQNRRVAEMSADPAAESPQRVLRSAQEAAALFADLPEALATTRRIADSCRLELGTRGPSLADLPADPMAGEKLRRHCATVLAQRLAAGGTWDPAHERRLAEELSLFERLGFSGLLLIVADILTFCRERGIPAVARGSAVSSLTLHLLGGSPVDPLALGLLFERFLHAGKSAWPDVDLDLPWHRRDEVIEWVCKRFGRGQTALVAAHHRFQSRSALREGLKAMGVRPALITALAGALPPEDLGIAEVDFLGLAQSIHSEDETLAGEDPPPGAAAGLERILPLVQRLIGRPRHTATHPGGIVIASGRLEEKLPLERAAKGVVITQYDLAAVAALGLVKIDLLGNRCLSELAETLQLAGRSDRLEDIRAEDPQALALAGRAATIGCFQLESPAMRSLLARLPIRRQSDLVAALALIRPGPAAGAAKESFVRRARGEAPADIFEPAIADRLAETYGMIIYEEDIMVLLSRIGGLTLGQADELRAAIVGSAGDAQTLAHLEAHFLGTARRSALFRQAPQRARKAWNAAVRFSAYSFNKAHAASYGHLAYFSAYMKAHHPLQFACALLNHHQGLYPLRTLAAEFVRMGIEIRPPQVNRSDYPSRIEEEGVGAGLGAIRMGLDKIKGLSVRSAHDLLEERVARGAFETLGGLLERVRLSSRDRRSLVLCGACDGLAPLSVENWPFMHELVLEKIKAGTAPGDLRRVRAPAAPLAGDRLRLYQALVRVQNELPLLEMHLSAHPLDLLRPEAERYGCLRIGEAAGLAAGDKVRLCVIVAAMRRVRTANGILQFLTLEDETGLLEAAVLPPLYQRMGNRVTTPGPFLVEGRLQRRHGAVHIEVTGLDPFHQRPLPYAS